MSSKNMPDFIIIDDDYINNVICQMVIQKELQATSINIFTIPKKGIEYINATYSQPDANDAVLILDINMPALNGWDVVDQLMNASVWVKQHLRIFIFSSSGSPQDKQKAADDPMVAGYIEKPLTQEKLRTTLRERVADGVD